MHTNGIYSVTKIIYAFICVLLPLLFVHTVYDWWFSPPLFLNLIAILCEAACAAIVIIPRIVTERKSFASQIEISVHGVSQSSLKAAVEEGSMKMKQLAGIAASIEAANVRSIITKIVDVVHEIIRDIEKDPKDLKLAKKFLSYYLDTTIAISRRYLDISGQKVQSAQMKETLEKAELILERMHQAFRQQLSRLLEDDIMDLNTELELLDKTIKAEGYDKDHQ